MLSSSTDSGKFLHKILLTNIQVTNLCKAFVNSSSANIILLKIQMSKKKKRFLVEFFYHQWNLGYY